MDQCTTTCHVPPQHRKDAEVVGQTARNRFARDLGEHLGPSLARQPAIIRIRYLPVRVLVPVSELNETALSIRWCQAFGKALFTALAYPTGVGPVEIYRADTIAAFVASAIHALLDGTAPDKWQYAEFEPFFRLGTTQASLALMCEWPQHSLAVLLLLAGQLVLGRVLARFDDVALERVFTVLTASTAAETGTLSVADLIIAARLILEHTPDKTIALRTRGYALHLFAEARRSNQPVPSPRTLFCALLALAVLLNEDVFWPGHPSGQSRAGRLPSNVNNLLEDIARSLSALVHQELSRHGVSPGEAQPAYLPSIAATILQSIGGVLRQYVQSTLHIDLQGSAHSSAGTTSFAGATSFAGLTSFAGTPSFAGTTSFSATSPSNSLARVLPGQLAELDQHLQLLRAELKIPIPPARPLEVLWISSDLCGLFFLLSTLGRLGWVDAWGHLPDFHRGGPACLVAGLAMAIAGKFDPAVPSLDPAIALFAGFVREPDLVHARGVFQNAPLAVRLRVLHAALPHEHIDEAARSWEATFERLADRLLLTFASRIRGFRQSTRSGTVRSFIARPGRIRIEPERLVVFPGPSPFNVALHISGMHDPLDASMWLGRRRVEFEWGDL